MENEPRHMRTSRRLWERSLTQRLIENTQLYHDGKWLWIQVTKAGTVEDIKTLLEVKRKPKSS